MFFVHDDRMVMFSNNVEPANGFLLRYLHRKAVEAYQKKEQDSARHQALLRVLDWIDLLSRILTQNNLFLVQLCSQSKKNPSRI